MSKNVLSKPMSRRQFLAASALGAAAVAVASYGVPAFAFQTTKKPKIGLVMKSLANEFFQQMDKGAKDYAAKHTDQFDFSTVGMKDERDFAAQVDAVENFITQKFDIIVVAPADSKAMVTPLAKAIKAGIVVINIDVELDKDTKTAAGIDLAFFGPDNAKGMKLAGDALAAKLGKGGKVVILEGNPEADNATQRKNGALAAIKDGGLTLLDSKTAHWDTDEANTLMTNFLTQYPDVQGAICANDSMVLGAVKAIDSANKTGKVTVVGFDNIPAAQALIRQDKLLATVEQYGSFMAVIGIQYGLRTLAGEKFTGWVQTPLELITKANVDQPLQLPSLSTPEATMAATMAGTAAASAGTMAATMAATTSP